ncbi:hypothetical protein D3C87_2101960 [compost metagenome]
MQAVVKLLLADKLVKPVECVIITRQQYLFGIMRHRGQSVFRTRVRLHRRLLGSYRVGKHRRVLVDAQLVQFLKCECDCR